MPCAQMKRRRCFSRESPLATRTEHVDGWPSKCDDEKWTRWPSRESHRVHFSSSHLPGEPSTCSVRVARGLSREQHRPLFIFTHGFGLFSSRPGLPREALVVTHTEHVEGSAGTVTRESHCVHCSFVRLLCEASTCCVLVTGWGLARISPSTVRSHCCPGACASASAVPQCPKCRWLWTWRSRRLSCRGRDQCPCMRRLCHGDPKWF